MRTEIARIQDQLNTTTIYVTHDQTEALTLGDRITVMRAGELQQVGTPADLYEHPVNLFVAGFIGSPSMNFLPAEIEGNVVRLPIGAVKIPDELRRRLESGRGRLFAGLRPEHFQDAALVPELSHGTSFKTKIRVLESMGSEYYAYFDVAAERVSSQELEELAQDTGAADIGQSREGTQMVARLDAASRVRQGEEAVLWFDARKLQLFDEETGRSLLVDGSTGTGQPVTSQPAPAG
jgi:multiple sugar transport system ATP-binding protein